MKILEKINIKENWKFYTTLLVVIIMILFLTTYMVNLSDKLYKKVTILDSEEYIEDVKTDTIISQKFIAEHDNLEKLYISFEPFKDNKLVGGNVLIGIKDENGNVIKEETITRNFIRENNTYKFKFKKQKESQGKQYELYIKFLDNSQYEAFYTVNYSKEIPNENYILTINNEKVDGTLVFSQLYLNQHKTTLYILLNIALVLLVTGISVYIYNKKNIKEENLFLLTVPIICFMFMISMPTFKNHDELYHWIRAYEVSTGVFATKIEDGVEGTELPAAITAIIKSDWTTTTYPDVKYALGIELDENDTYRIDSAAAAVYAFIQYIPQAIGIAIARIFTSKPLIMTYAGRIFNILFSMFILYKAIKLMPFGKKIFLTLSYIPIAIEGFSSLSPDAMTISMSFLYIAYILNLAFNENKKVGKKEKITLTILSIIVALCKIVYIPLVLLLFIIPKEKFCNDTENKKLPKSKKIFDKQNKTKFINIVIIAGIAIVINLLWLSFTSRYLTNFREGDSKYQVILLFQNPINYIGKLIYTVNLNGTSYLTGMLGESLGWGELVRLNFIVPSVMFILILIEVITDETLRNKFSLSQKLVLLGTLLIIVLLIFTSLYVQWTTIGSESILGVQGRYFIPILPLLILLLGDIIKTKSSYKDINISKVIAITGLTINIITILKIVICHM